MTEKALDYEIENVGGVDHVSFQLSPGVNVLRGRNGAGKTSALNAVVRAQGGKVALERRDGSEGGVVSGPGVTLHVRQVVKASGEAELELADIGPLARLIDPGIKDTEAAARERIRALIELLDLGIDDDALERLVGEDRELMHWLRNELKTEAIDDLMLAAEKLRHKAHALAREHEHAAEEATTEAKAATERCVRLLDAIGGTARLTDDSPEDAKAELDRAIRSHERALAQCEAREALEARQEEIRRTIGERPDSHAKGEALSEAKAKLHAADEQVAWLRTELAAAEKAQAVAASELASAEKELDAAVEARRKWDEQDAVLQQPLTGPTREELAELQRTVVEGAREKARRAEESAAYRVEERTRTEAHSKAEADARAAKRYRELAAGIPSKLGEILETAGAPGLTVVDGRLHALRNGGDPKDYERRCSTGERVALALDVAATAYRGNVLPLDGAFWTSLDPEHRVAFAELARERGLYVLTEEPTGGSLRVETETGRGAR